MLFKIPEAEIFNPNASGTFETNTMNVISITCYSAQQKDKCANYAAGTIITWE